MALLPMLCIVVMISGLPGIGTAALFPVASSVECDEMRAMLRYYSPRRPLYVFTAANLSVAGDKSVILDVRMDAEAHLLPLDTTAKYADNLAGLTPNPPKEQIDGSAAGTPGR